MRLLALCAALTALTAVAASPARAFDERPMHLPAVGPGAVAAAAQPATWLVAAEPGSAQAAAIARRHGARKLRVGAVYRVATSRARAFAGELRAAGALRYAEADAPLRRASALDALPTGYARGLVVAPDLVPPPVAGAATIAVVDDLVDVTHPDLAGNVRQLNPGPVLGPHGTMVASTAAAALNGGGVFGIFPSAPILSVGMPPQITCADAANAIVAAAQTGARVINLSFGGAENCTTLYGAVQLAYARNSLVVASSGNEFAAGNPVVYPAAYPHVLSVAALDPTLHPSSFSSENAAVDVAAPGVGVPVAIPLAFDVEDGTADGVTLADGTSFAAPIVAGAAAWLATARHDLTNGQIADVLRRSALDVEPAGYDPGSGFGLIQMKAALAYPTPERDLLEPNDGISFVDGSVFRKADPYVWRGLGSRTLRGSADSIEDPVDVFRIQLPARSRARIRLRPAFGNPDLYVFRSNARSLDERARIVARSRRPTKRTESLTLVNRGPTARRFYLDIEIGDDAEGSLNADYRLELVRTKYRS